MDTYITTIKFKNLKTVDIRSDTEEDLRDKLEKEWATIKKEGILRLGDYFIVSDEILWIKVKGERFEKPTG